MTVAQKYMKAAGYPSGKYTGCQGHDRRQQRRPGSAGDADRPERAQALGSRRRSRPSRSRRCTRSSAATSRRRSTCARRPAGSRTSPTRYAVLFVPFSGQAIVPINNTNWALLERPEGQRRDRPRRDDQGREPAPSGVRQGRQDDHLDSAAAIPEVWADNALLQGFEDPRRARPLERRLGPVVHVADELG